MTPLPKNGLYAITDPTLTPTHTLIEQVSVAIRGGARIIQFRDKTTAHSGKLQLARKLLTLCNQAGVPLIINDDITLAKEVSADGVHLGSDDKPIAEARQLLGPKAIIGISCYNNCQQAEDAQQQGANYVAFGRFYPSETKPSAPQAGIETLKAAKQRLRIPIVAIGGITTENGRILAEAGADFLAVIGGVFAQKDPQLSAQHFAEIYYNQQKSQPTETINTINTRNIKKDLS